MNLVLTNILETLVLASPRKAITFGHIVISNIKSGKNVTMDFSGVRCVTVGFLYFLFSKVAKECGKDIARFVNVVNASPNVKQSFKYLKDNYDELNCRFSKLDFATT